MTIKRDSKIGIRNEWQHLDSAENVADFVAYLERVEASSHLQLYHESLLKGLHVNDGDCLLDLASGIGTISRILRASFSNADLIVGIDLSLTMARHAQTINRRKGIQGIDFTCGDVATLPFSEAVFDGVISSRILNEGKYDVYWKDSNGTGDAELIGSYANQQTYPWAWSVDGKKLVTLDIFGGGFNIGFISMEGDHTHKPLLQEKYREFQSKISPNGRWMAYTSDESGENQIYVRPFPDIDKDRWQVSTEGGHSPLWSPDGRELFYRKDNEVIAVSIEIEPTFKYGKRKVLFSGNYIGLLQNDSHTWDIHPDGKRFLMMKPTEASDNAPETVTPRKINIVLNWFEELKEKVPAE